MEPAPEVAILQLLENNGQTPVTEIADRLDTHPVTIDRQCYELQQDDYIMMAAVGGVYRLTDRGRERLDALADEE